MSQIFPLPDVGEGLTEAEIKALTHDDNFDPDEPGKPI